LSFQRGTAHATDPPQLFYFSSPLLFHSHAERKEKKTVSEG